MTNHAASRAVLVDSLAIDAETADRIRAIWKARNVTDILTLCPDVETWRRSLYSAPAFREIKRQAVSLAAGSGFHGLEHLGRRKRDHGDIYYLNAGDTYTPTIVFCRGRLFVSTWGDLVESGRVNLNDGGAS